MVEIVDGCRGGGGGKILTKGEPITSVSGRLSADMVFVRERPIKSVWLLCASMTEVWSIYK